jgi:hypothetical protein
MAHDAKAPRRMADETREPCPAVLLKPSRNHSGALAAGQTSHLSE